MATQAEVDWFPHLPKWSNEEYELLANEISVPNDVSLSSFIEKSDCFPRPFPIDNNRCKNLKNLVDQAMLERNINSAYPILHEHVLHLCAKFIIHKRQHGNAVEKTLYKDINLLQFIDRLLNKRAVVFMGKHDLYTLLSGKKGSQQWESVGTVNEKTPLLLKNCLSYEKIKLSVFLSVSSYTYFINIGNRKNFGVFRKERDDVADEGIIIGIIGPRLVKDEVMEYQEIIVTKKQNNKNNGYGNLTLPTTHHLFAKFYDEECLEYDEIIDKINKSPRYAQRFITLKNGEMLDKIAYYKRLLFTIDTLFLEANQRALEKNTTAYIHVVGIGLGVWKKSPHQNKIFMDSCGQRIKMLAVRLNNVSDICFSYVQHDACLNYKHGDTMPIEGHPCKGIKIHICKREPHTRLTRADANKLLVVSYAWDGNALPGNEYWNKKLGSSGDSAAASSTQISEIHNPFINPKVCAANLKVVTADGLLGLAEYITILKTEKKRKREA